MAQPDEGLTLDSTLEGSRATVVAHGELDISTRRIVSDELTRLVAEGASGIEIDMSEVTFMDSTGLGALLEVRRLGATLTIKDPSERVRRVLDLVLVSGIEGIDVI